MNSPRAVDISRKFSVQWQGHMDKTIANMFVVIVSGIIDRKSFLMLFVINVS